MSNVYILEPPTSGKVLLKTTVGDIDVELWAKETPKTCRNFIQLCLEGYYDGTIFHRIVKGFIAQGGDPNGDGTGGESVYGEMFKDEFHQRLRFTHRGILAMANADKDDNGSQFFFTLAATPDLQNKHTIFGKVTGETIFNMLKLEEGLIKDERPEYPNKILKTEVLNNPFPDIVPRVKEITVVKKKKKERTPGVKNFKLLSFGTEAEEDEEETARVNEQFTGKGKSTHDVLDDPKLSSETGDHVATEKEGEESEDTDPEERLENIKRKLKSGGKRKPKKPKVEIDETEDWDLGDERREAQKKKFDEIKKEIQSVKRDYHKNKLKRSEESKEVEKAETTRTNIFKEYNDERDKYKSITKSLPKKGAGREEFTLGLLAKFKERLQSAKEVQEEKDDEEKIEKVETEIQEGPSEEVGDNEKWLSHKLYFKSDDPVLAKDANTKDDDWFEIYDPRNKLNKRRRGEAPASGNI